MIDTDMETTMPDTRPNILWISFEDTSPRFGCFHDAVARTPNVDRLATQGCRFRNAFATAGVCAPSRFSIITGCYAPSMGAHHMRTTHRNRVTPEMPTPYDTLVPHTVRCFSEYFRAAGYYCSNNVKTDYQFRAPATAWDDCSTTAHWRHRDPGQPFFAVFNPMTTHESGQWPEADPGPTSTDPDAVTVPPYLPDTPAMRRAIAAQYDHIADNDRLVGRLLAELDEDGLADDTIVVVWSDHGEGLPRGKRWLYDAGIRVPLVVRWPGHLEPDSADDRLVSLIDLAPTMLACSGLPVPAVMQGQAFLGPTATPRDYVHAARDRFDEAYDMVRAVRDRRFKYIRNHRPELPYLLWIPYRNRHPVYAEIWDRYRAGTLDGPLAWFARTWRPAEELYDCDADPHEIDNLADDPAFAADLARLRAEHDAWRRAIDDKGDLDEARMVRAWYPDGRPDTVAAPVFVPIAAGRPGIEAIADPGDGAPPWVQLSGDALLQLHCATQGAAILWTTDEGDDARWHYYRGPIRLDTGRGRTVRARACRIGYEPSPESRCRCVVR